MSDFPAFSAAKRAQALERLADHEQFADGVGGQFDDVDANPRAPSDQPAFKALQRFAERTAADAETSCQVRFG